MNEFFSHIHRNRPAYIWLPFALLLVWLFAILVSHSTGRPVIEDPGALVGWGLQMVKAALIVVVAAQVKRHIFDDIDTRKLMEPLFVKEAFVPWHVSAAIIIRILIDTGESIFLLLFFAWILSN